MGDVFQSELNLLSHILLRNLDILSDVGKGVPESVEIHGQFGPLAFAHTDKKMVVIGQGLFCIINGLVDNDISAVDI